MYEWYHSVVAAISCSSIFIDLLIGQCQNKNLETEWKEGRKRQSNKKIAVKLTETFGINKVCTEKKSPINHASAVSVTIHCQST